MPIDLNDYRPRLNDWYRSSGIYRGTGTVSKGDVIRATGPIEVTWNDIGETIIAMDLSPNQMSLGHELLEEDGLSVRLETADGGLFTTDRAIVINNHMHFGPEGMTSRIELSTFRSTYSSIPDRPAYWVIPAVNFVGDVCFSSPALAKHPLRVYFAPEISQDLSADDKITAEVAANQKERLLPFSFDGKPAFIERLPDFEAKN